MTSEIAESKVAEMMQWFVNLDAPLQQGFIQNVFSEKFRGSHVKSEDSIGLLSMQEGNVSYLIESVDP